MTVIEIGLCGIKPNHAVMDTSTPEGAILNRAWGSVTSNPLGPHWAFGGLEVNDPSKLWGFFSFDSVSHHEEFARTFGKEAVKDLPSILTHQIFQKHVAIDEEGIDLSEVLRQGMVEVTFLYFAAEIEDEGKEEVSKKVREIVAREMATCKGVKAVRFGWSVENDFPMLKDEGKQDRTGAVLALFVGCSKAQNDFRDIDGVRGLADSIAEAHDVVHSVTRVIQCREFGRGRDPKKHYGDSALPS